MQHSDTITKISEAILKAQKEITAASKDAANPFFKSKYADLNSVMGACKDELNKNGISVLQPVTGESVETVLLHESGEWLSSETKIICAKPNDPQAQGSAITYARRYGLQSMVFIGAEDDDGEKAMDRHGQDGPAVPTKPQTTGLHCDYHNTEMKLNKNGKPYHMDRTRPEGDQFCNGMGFQGEKDAWRKKMTTPVDETVILLEPTDRDFEDSIGAQVAEEIPF